MAALVAQGKLSTPKLTRLLMQDVCHYFTQLQQQQQQQGHQQQQQAQQQEKEHGEPEETAPSRGDMVEQLRRCFSLLALFAQAQPEVLQQEVYVRVVLEVGFSPDLAVSTGRGLRKG